MGRERQKAKNRSSIPKARKKPKSKKQLLHHPIIKANWDQSKTLSQNYRRLGLTSKLGKHTGGTEKSIEDALIEREGLGKRDALTIDDSMKKAEKMEVGEARIERDAETGAILRVIDGSLKHTNPLNDPLNELDSDEDGSEAATVDQQGNVKVRTASAPATTEVVEQLEQEASRPVSKYKRKQPEGERVFVEALVEKYGGDYGKMARDVKINYMQRSEGDLKKRVKRWKDAGGVIDIVPSILTSDLRFLTFHLGPHQADYILKSCATPTTCRPHLRSITAKMEASTSTLQPPEVFASIQEADAGSAVTKEAGGQTSTTSPTHCRLLELPAEIRNSIYGLALIEPQAILLYNDGCHLPLDRSLTIVNRQTRREALPIFLGNFAFHAAANPLLKEETLALLETISHT